MMKKSLVALAVIAASGLAMAQSSVTLYGVADGGIGKDKLGDGANAKTRVTSGGDNVNNGPSRIGLTGIEDLGNGNKVGFQFESGLSLADGATFGAGGGFWGRQANVFVAGGWGAIKVGRQFTVTHLTEGAYDLTGLANYSVVRGTYQALNIGARAPAAIAYVSPNMGGLTAAVAFVSKNNIPGATKNIWDAGVMYSNGGLGAGLSVNKGAHSGDKTNYQLGAKFGVGSFTAAAGYHNAHNAAGAVRRGFNLGASANVGAFTLTLDATRDTKNHWGTKKYTNAVLEAKYALSKRTFFYADALRLDGTNNWGLGIHHSF